MAAKPSKKLTAALCVVLAAVLGVLIWLWTTYGAANGRYECTNFAMGSYIQQTVYGKNGEAAAAAAAGSIGSLENLISWRIEGSDIARLNGEAGSDWLELDPKTISLLQMSLEVAEKSGGAFDPTILPLSSMWDFGGENQHLPEKAQIEKFLPYINYKDLRVDGNEASLRLHYNAVDLGAIGKGAACGEGIAAYREAGVSGGIIAVGGSVGVFGKKPGGSPWSIAVRDPESGGDQGASIGALQIDTGFVSTSGSYEKKFVENGVTYHHLLNPKTGYPENNGLVSVTIWHENGAISDALATACFVLGREKGMSLAESYGAGALMIDEDHRIFINDKLKDRFTLDAGGYTLSGESA